MTRASLLFEQSDAAYASFDDSILGPEFPGELDLVSRLWFRCGYRPGIGAYLNVFLLRDFITTHDTNYPPRFETFKSMATSFYRTDLFIRDVTDSGREATGESPARRLGRNFEVSSDATSGFRSRPGCRPTSDSACRKTSRSSVRP